jgi:hypothetical protein
MLLTGRGLWVHLCNHWLYLTELPREFCGAFARVLVDPVHAGAAILAHVVQAVVHVCRAIVTTEKGRKTCLKMYLKNNSVNNFAVKILNILICKLNICYVADFECSHCIKLFRKCC